MSWFVLGWVWLGNVWLRWLHLGPGMAIRWAIRWRMNRDSTLQPPSRYEMAWKTIPDRRWELLSAVPQCCQTPWVNLRHGCCFAHWVCKINNTKPKHKVEKRRATLSDMKWASSTPLACRFVFDPKTFLPVPRGRSQVNIDNKWWANSEGFAGPDFSTCQGVLA